MGKIRRVMNDKLHDLMKLAVFDVWGRVAETGSGNKWPLLAFKSARLEQLGDMLTFCKGLRFLFYGTPSLSY